MLFDRVIKEVRDQFELVYHTYFLDECTHLKTLTIVGKGTLALPEDAHDEWYEIDVTPNPGVIIKTAFQEYSDSHNSMVMIYPGIRHAGIINVNERFFGASLFLHRQSLPFDVSHPDVLVIPDPDSRIKKLAAILADASSQHDRSLNDDFVHNLATLLVGELRKKVMGQTISPALSRLVQYIETHYRDELSIDIFEKKAAMSRFHLIKRFKGLFGVPPMRYVNEFRLNKAAELLKNYPNLNISEIALESGFRDLSTFNHAFKKKFEVTPTLYRGMLSNPNQ